MKKLKALLVVALLALTSSLFAVPQFGLSEATYDEILSKSLVSTGNNYRLKKFIEKLRNGEQVYIAALGGSVTEGEGPANYRDGYVYQFNKKLCDAFASNRQKVSLDNAGLCGTTSVLGLVRYQQDVVMTLKHKPDLLIIEYAVNDSGEPTKQRAFEALIHDALEAYDDCAIVVVYSAAVYPKTQKQMKPIADYYGLPQVSASDAYDYGIKQQYFKQQQYLKDVVHPLKEGHEVMADCLMYMFNAVDKMPLDKNVEVPSTPLKTPDFFGFKRLMPSDSNAVIVDGSFTRLDENTQTLKKTGKGAFSHNWSHNPKAGNESLKITLTCKNFVLCYKEQGNWLPEKFGKAEIYVDGKIVMDGNKGYYDGGNPTGWNNCVNLLLIDKDVSAEHTIEIKMAKGSEKKGFTVLCMGYTK